MNKKIMIPLFVVLGMVTFVVAYQILSLTSHIQIAESQQFYYSEDGTTWYEVPLASTDLGQATIPAGSLQPFLFKEKNNANRQIMTTATISNSDPMLKFSVTCFQPGTEYRIVSGGEFGQGLTLQSLIDGESEEAMYFNTIVSADATPTVTFSDNPITTIERNEVDTSITDWITCS